MQSSLRSTQFPHIAVRCPWTGRMLTYRETDFPNPDEFLNHYGHLKGYIKNTYKKNKSKKGQR